MTARLWIATTAILVVAGLAFLYIGVTHRDRCMKNDLAGCTILPWSGHHPDGWGNSGYLLPGARSSP